MQAIATGDETAMREFYQSFHGVVYAFALRRLSHSAEAADVLNEVMLEVWRHAARFEGRSKVQTWLLGIANHKIIDKLRQRKHSQHEVFDDDIADENNPTALDAIAGAEDAARVRDCIEGLSDAHRQVVHLAFFEELSYGEIAQIAACPEGTVKTRMFYAKQALKRCLAAAMQDID